MTIIRRIRRWWDWLEINRHKPLHVFEEKGKPGKIVISKDLWVTITDGNSSDALPLNFCSQELVDKLEEVLRKRYGMKERECTPDTLSS